MKKITLTILAILLTFGVSANATMSLTVDNVSSPEYTININDIVDIGIAKNNSGLCGAIIAFEPSSGLNVFFSLVQFPPEGIIPDPSIIPNATLWGVDIPSPAGQYDIGNLEGLANGNVYVTLYSTDDWSTFTIVDDVTIHIVPEPATFALLGLGGLFLRRHK